MKIVIADERPVFSQEQISALKKYGEVDMTDSPLTTEERRNRLQDAEIVIVWHDFTKEDIEAAPKLKMICTASSGYDYVDSVFATEKGIMVTHCPGNNAEAVAEYTVLLMLASIRKIKKAVLDTNIETFSKIGYKGTELSGKSLGVIGYGRIGKRVGEIAEKGFGMKVHGVDSSSSQSDLEAVLSTSDILSINLPINDKTKSLIGEKEFDLMKQGVILVNTGRGGVIDESVLVKNIQSGKIAAAGLDVLTEEPFNFSSPLFSFENVVITPHTAWNTKETDERLPTQIVEIIEAFAQGTPKYIIPEQGK